MQNQLTYYFILLYKMAFPQQILDDIVRAKEFYSELNSDNISDCKTGLKHSCKCSNKLSCLNRLIISLDYLASIGDYNDVAKANYNHMIKMIGGTAFDPGTPMKIHYGNVDTIDNVTIDIIESLPFINYWPWEDIIIPFNNTNFGIALVALPIGISIPNKYKNLNSPDDTGNIGGEGDLLGSPYYEGGFNVIQGTYTTKIVDPFLLYTI